MLGKNNYLISDIWSISPNYIQRELCLALQVVSPKHLVWLYSSIPKDDLANCHQHISCGCMIYDNYLLCGIYSISDQRVYKWRYVCHFKIVQRNVQFNSIALARTIPCQLPSTYYCWCFIFNHIVTNNCLMWSICSISNAQVCRRSYVWL